jgi:hypothetical protein
MFIRLMHILAFLVLCTSRGSANLCDHEPERQIGFIKGLYDTLMPIENDIYEWFHQNQNKQINRLDKLKEELVTLLQRYDFNLKNLTSLPR